jgi:hypothetical protein
VPEIPLTPDGVRYLAAAQARPARPFALRWILPALLGDRVIWWLWVTRGSLVAVGVLTAIYTRNPWMASVAFLPGLAFSWRYPVLVDATGMALALAAAVLFPICWPAAIALALLAGCVRETAPGWAALYAWHPALLVGLVPAAVRALFRPGPDVLDAENAWILAHPVLASKKYHRGQWLDWSLMLAPWAGMLAGLAALDLRLGAALAAGYAQLLVATDSVRLYQWAAPALALACVHVLPGWALPFVALSVLYNPWKGSGV